MADALALIGAQVFDLALDLIELGDVVQHLSRDLAHPQVFRGPDEYRRHYCRALAGVDASALAHSQP